MDHDRVQLAHGSGGLLSAQLIDRLFLPRFANPILNRLEDQATLALPAGRVAMSIDTFVVDPIFFPGGTIGDLAVNGTVNDVAMSGARPLYLAAAFVLEEGLPLVDLHRVLVSMEEAARTAGVAVVTGDTKVVQRGGCDKIFITTTGIGVVPFDVTISAAGLRPGDAILLSGTLADHGMAILTTRQGLSFHSRIQSDTVALYGLVEAILAVCPAIHALRDPTRGGAAATLNEFARASRVGIELEEGRIAVRPDVRGACEVLGIDPLFVANEGKLIAAVPGDAAAAVLAAMRSHPDGRDAAIIGRVTAEHPGLVVLHTALGAQRIVEMPVAEQLPRIC
jgi:hydrogenase expression/formation protein HypE